MSYETIKMWYEKGLWNNKMVAQAVKKGIITAEQYNELTGLIYPATK